MPPEVPPEITIDIAARIVPGARREHLETNLPLVISALEAAQLGDKPMILMALATIRVETGSFEPISEFESRFNTSPGGHPFDLYDSRKDLGNTGAPDGAAFKGRGFIQLTGRSNYVLYGPKLTPPVDLVADPEIANSPRVAADLLSLFLADRELQIKDAIAHGNMQAARRLVNGGVNGLDRFTDAYNIGSSLMS